MSFVAKFRLDEANASRIPAYDEKGNWTGSYQPGVKIKMSAVKGDAFGKATPYGVVEMTIANGPLADHLIALFTEFVRNPSNTAKAPVFRATFVEDDE